jgi:hypothetical protein
MSKSKLVCMTCGRPLYRWLDTWKHAANMYTAGRCPRAVPVGREHYERAVRLAIARVFTNPRDL